MSGSSSEDNEHKLQPVKGSPITDEDVVEPGKKKKKVSEPHEEPTCLSSSLFIAKSSWINLLLVFVPIGIAIGATEQDGTAVFIINFLAIVPLAKLLGEATEQLALHTSQSVGGLLNATFGNLVEIIIGIIALKEGLIRVVQSSLIGSILSNLLLVLGMCFVAGGVKYNTLKFNQTAAQTSAGVLFLAVLAVVVPAALNVQVADELAAETASFLLKHLNDSNATLHVTGLPVTQRLLILSRGTAIIMLIVYGLFLFFQLHTHADLYADAEGEEDEEFPEMTAVASVAFLAVITALVGVCSEYLVSSIEHITTTWGISETFAGMVLLPIVGNAAEHLTAVTVAMKNKIDLSIGVAVGSSQQIAMMVTPLMVILGWIIDQGMSLYFEVFETAVLFMTVLVVFSLIGDGESNWLEGAMLLAVYVILAIAFYVV